jgi:hypothetical protein
MRTALKLSALLFILAAFVLTAAPAQAVSGSWVCTVSPGHGPVGTTFGIGCSGFSPNTILNVYAVEPDGRASGLNIYGFFPTSIKTDSSGAAGFRFVTEIPGFSSVPPGTYIFVVHELAPGGGIASEAHIPVVVDSSPRPLVGAILQQVGSTQQGLDDIRSFVGTGFAPFEAVNIWVTQPPASQCSGLGIDQLTLGTLPGNGSSLWKGPGTVKADASGTIAFTIDFHVSNCTGQFWVSAHALGSGIGAETSIWFTGLPVGPTNALVFVSPDPVPAFHSFHVVSGTGFPANTGVNCWYTRPDGRVLSFIDVNAKTDSSGSFSVGSTLDDFPPFTSTEPGMWAVTCATPDHSVLGIGRFMVVGLLSDP